MATSIRRARPHGLMLLAACLATPLTAVTTGAAHAAVSGTVVGWGANDSGQSSAPSGLHDVVAVAGGAYHTVALKRDGSVLAGGPAHGMG
ncbi:RCC1 domain-containing protein [Azohydromonas lata]|uniref:RCC1 domain-containing protein n=1 Tax=Azohydromonas lata TaxID=45677 RepID=UPI0012F4F5E9|nr:RCC1 domain-containing protein [Azohydromonas lata]